MVEKKTSVFKNTIKHSIIKKAIEQKKKYIKLFGTADKNIKKMSVVENKIIGPFLGVKNLDMNNDGITPDYNKSIIIGTIRMGFGHYRIAMAIASAAHHSGYTPLWFDIPSFKETTGGKIVSRLNNLYSLGSKLSQKFSLFNKLYWEPLNYSGFKKLSYNASDQKITELMAPLCNDFPKDTPFIATHVWPAQAAIHSGMTKVINVIPDNWPMALHLSEGAIHTVQSFSSYLGYRSLREMGGQNTILKPMNSNDIVYTGHYIDHELVVNLEEDCRKRLSRLRNNNSKRILLTVGGAGAQKEIFAEIIKYILPEIKNGEIVLFINVGDHQAVWDDLKAEIKELGTLSTTHFNNWDESFSFVNHAIDDDRLEGIHVFYDADIYAAVYVTNVLIRASDLLVTKPSELSFYPIPKLFIKRVGGHEAWGAIRSAEIGDGSFECETSAMTKSILELMITDNEILIAMIENILCLNQQKIYNGAYNVLNCLHNFGG